MLLTLNLKNAKSRLSNTPPQETETKKGLSPIQILEAAFERSVMYWKIASDSGTPEKITLNAAHKDLLNNDLLPAFQEARYDKPLPKFIEKTLKNLLESYDLLSPDPFGDLTKVNHLKCLELMALLKNWQ